MVFFSPFRNTEIPPLEAKASKTRHRSLYAVCLMILFWALFDATVSYVAPLAITDAGVSKTMLGLIIGSSSMFGAAFDFVLSKYLINTHFRRVYLILFALCFVYPLVLWHATSIWIFIISMAIWGIYYDFINFGTFDFVGRKSEEKDHSSHFGKITIFRASGYLIAPLVVGLVLGEAAHIDWQAIGLMYIFLTIAAVFYLVVVLITKREKDEHIAAIAHKKLNFLQEIHLWGKVGKILLPILLLTMFFNMFDSFFWTLGPILAESFTELHPFNGLFLTMYSLPSLIMGWFVGNFTNRFGKKRTAFVSFFIGSVVLSFFGVLHHPFLILADVFVASFFLGLTLPAINGAYADYLSESITVEREIEAVSDFFTNLGYIFGPILAGFLADQVGNTATFSLLGIICSIATVILFLVTPRKIVVIVDKPSHIEI